jgi:hypothetical protein
MDARTANMKNGRKQATACQGARNAEPDPGMMQSIEEYQEIPKGEAAMMPVREPRKRHKICNLAKEHRQKRKEPGEVVDPGGSWLPLECVPP